MLLGLFTAWEPSWTHICKLKYYKAFSTTRPSLGRLNATFAITIATHPKKIVTNRGTLYNAVWSCLGNCDVIFKISYQLMPVSLKVVSRKEHILTSVLILVHICFSVSPTRWSRALHETYLDRTKGIGIMIRAMQPTSVEAHSGPSPSYIWVAKSWAKNDQPMYERLNSIFAHRKYSAEQTANDSNRS